MRSWLLVWAGGALNARRLEPFCQDILTLYRRTHTFCLGHSASLAAEYDGCGGGGIECLAFTLLINCPDFSPTTHSTLLYSSFSGSKFLRILQDQSLPSPGVAPFLYTPNLTFLHPASSVLTLPFTFCHLKNCRSLFLRYTSCYWFIPLYSFTFHFIGVLGGRNHE